MRRAVCRLLSRSPYSQSRYIQEKKPRDESHADFEKRTWMQRCHYNEEGYVYIPPMSFKNCLTEAAKYKSIQIPGKGKSTYTRHIKSGVMVINPLVLPYTKDTIQCEWLHVSSTGIPGGSSRVEKCFPLIPKWEGDVEFLVLDDIVTEDVFEDHLRDAGSFIGVGRFRPSNNGFYGRFSVESIQWK